MSFTAIGTTRSGRHLSANHKIDHLFRARPLADPRRLAVGDIWDDHCVSLDLIAAVAPALGVEDARCLEAAIIRWQYYSGEPTDADARFRLDQRRFSRRHRLPLLRVFPFQRLSRAGRRYLQEEERAFPDESYRGPSPSRMQRIDSPMSADQMTDAKDEDIVRLFEILADATEWDHPTRNWPDRVGGSIQASREFAEFAKAAPDRALRIVDSFQPRKTERPAGDALAALGASEVPAGALIGCIRQLDGRGFASEPFRIGAATCLREVARRNGGLDDDTCALIEGWITERSAAHNDGGADSDDAIGTTGDSILWDLQGLDVLPEGNYPILDALMLGYLLRNQPDLNGWLAVLERHLKRDEEPKVWTALARDMPCLVDADDGHGIAFLGALVARYPTILNTESGVQLIGQIVDRLPEWMTSRIVDRWVSGDWAHGPQAAGEIAMLNLCRRPDSPAARVLVDRFLSGDGLDQGIVERLQVGLTYTLAEAWHHPELRPLSTGLLVRIVSTAPSAAATALHSVFLRTEPLPVDTHTRELLEAVLKRPAVLVGRGAYFLVKSLKDLLYDDGYRGLVCDVARTSIERAGQTRIESDAVQDLSDLADLALTLHRIPDTKEYGLDLFERLLKADAPGLSESLRMIDRPAFR